ncbi:hypothetical protein [Clostridium sp. DJ247]|uniref:hypothetical protein n=1 Tax=Clostridium sp. DJ247 TaxID=2726188 RepID=UPI0016264E45|nr:hypothetical protein [Clostridium sp. DJ247]MBC2581585.1 hypothetical protein [Clostridium sp. DJ247]
MRGFKRLLVWSLIPILIELLGLLYLDNFYLKDETSFNTEKMDLTSKKAPNKINIKIPDSADDIQVSYKGNYISYYDNGVINVVDTSNNKKKEIQFDNNTKLSYYKWLNDKNIMLIAEKYYDVDGDTYIKFESYSAKKDEKMPVSDEKNKQLKISIKDEKSEVQDIGLPGAGNVTYVKLGKEGTRSKIYRINVMAQWEQVNYQGNKLGNIEAFYKEDRLIYEDIIANRIRATGLKDPIATGENAKHNLLKVDNEDNIYIGNGEGDSVNKIFVVNLKKNNGDRKVITLKEPVKKSNIYITMDGKIYVNNTQSNVVTDIESGKETQYTGTLLKIYNYGIISKNNGKLIGTLF